MLLKDGVGAGNEGQGLGDHFVAGADARSPEGEMKSRGAARQGDGWASNERLEGLFELGQVGADGGQPIGVEGFLDIAELGPAHVGNGQEDAVGGALHGSTDYTDFTDGEVLPQRRQRGALSADGADGADFHHRGHREHRGGEVRIFTLEKAVGSTDCTDSTDLKQVGKGCRFTRRVKWKLRSGEASCASPSVKSVKSVDNQTAAFRFTTTVATVAKEAGGSGGASVLTSRVGVPSFKIQV